MAREPKRRLLVVCEGARTEPDYIDGFTRASGDAIVELRVLGGVGAPITIVATAKALREDGTAKAKSDPNEAFNEVWCVFDRDEHPSFKEAIDMAQANGLKLAISNPCFELWLLLHFRDSPGARHRHEVQRMLRDDHLPGYDKKLKFEDVAGGVEQATRRAKRLLSDAQALGDGLFKNPTTSVYGLTESIAGVPRGDGS
ncbi:MAG: RloB family protein [Myxococcota bacterium]